MTDGPVPSDGVDRPKAGTEEAGRFSGCPFPTVWAGVGESRRPAVGLGLSRGGPSRRPCISEWRPAPTPASRTPLGAGKAPELMSCNYPLRRAAGRPASVCVCSGFLLPRAPPPRGRPPGSRSPLGGGGLFPERSCLWSKWRQKETTLLPSRLSWTGSSE